MSAHSWEWKRYENGWTCRFRALQHLYLPVSGIFSSQSEWCSEGRVNQQIRGEGRVQVLCWLCLKSEPKQTSVTETSEPHVVHVMAFNVCPHVFPQLCPYQIQKYSCIGLQVFVQPSIQQSSQNNHSSKWSLLKLFWVIHPVIITMRNSCLQLWHVQQISPV